MPARKKASRKPRKKTAARKRAPKKRVATRKKPTAKKKTAARKAPPKKPAPKAPPAPPSAIGMTSHHVDYTTHDLAAVKRFYTELLGFASFSLDENFNYLFVQTGTSSSLGFMPPMEGMGEPSPPKEPTLYFMVKDVDRAYAALTARGVMFQGPPADMPWGHRVVHTTDPEGRLVMLATTKSKP